MKFAVLLELPLVHGSRPPRGGWIEIVMNDDQKLSLHVPPPHGAGGLKSIQDPVEGDPGQVPPPTGRVD